MEKISSGWLISEVLKHPILYDINNIGYHDDRTEQKKNNVWKLLGSNFQQAKNSTVAVNNSSKSLWKLQVIFRVLLTRISFILPSVLWRCWLGGRKGIRHIKNWAVGCWHGYLPGARCRLACPSWCHCHSLSLASVKSKLVLPFWYRLTRVVPDKGPLNGCVCVCAFHVFLREKHQKHSTRTHRLTKHSTAVTGDSNAQWSKAQCIHVWKAFNKNKHYFTLSCSYKIFHFHLYCVLCVLAENQPPSMVPTLSDSGFASVSDMSSSSNPASRRS